MSVLTRLDQQIAAHKSGYDRGVRVLLILALAGMAATLLTSQLGDLLQFLPF